MAEVPPLNDSFYNTKHSKTWSFFADLAFIPPITLKVLGVIATLPL